MRDPDDAAQAITAALWRAMLQRGRGTVKQTEKAIGLYQDGLRGTKNSKNGLRLRHVTEAIKALGIPPSVFFNDAIGGVSSTAAERFMARGAEFAARKLVELPTLADNMKLDRLTEDDLARLDAARFEDPRAAAEQAAGIARLAARDGRLGDAAAAVARQGSALRVAEMWEPAWVCVWWALRYAPDGPIKANSWLRSSSIVSDFGEFDDAAELAHSSMVASAECGDLTSIGPALTSRGMFLRRAEIIDEAIPVLNAALEVLPESARTIRFSVFQNLALAHLQRREIRLATWCAEQADRIEDLPTSFKIHLQWLRARIAAKRDAHDDAIRLYLASIPDLEGSPADAALASAELCRVYLEANSYAEAVSVALGMARLTLSKQQNPIVGATIVDLYRSAHQGSLSIGLAERAIGQIRIGLRRRAVAATTPRRQ